MSDNGHNSIYYKVFGALIVLTVITVALKNLHVGIALAVTLALLVATIKASLVASFFMHLIAEKKTIYMVLSLTAIFAVGMIGLILLARYSTPHGTVSLEKLQTENAHAADGQANAAAHHASEKQGGHH